MVAARPSSLDRWSDDDLADVDPSWLFDGERDRGGRDGDRIALLDHRLRYTRAGALADTFGVREPRGDEGDPEGPPDS
jgi:hypothetical protein